MYIFYSGPGGCYASAGTSRRDGDRTFVETIYLGRVLDREKGIYRSRERGVFTFDPENGIFGKPPEGYTPPRIPDRRRRDTMSRSNIEKRQIRTTGKGKVP